jgi:hypothetical protein
MSGQILIKVNANPLIGTGHLLRSLTLARYWTRQGGRVLYVTGRWPRILLRQIAMAGCQVQPLPTESGVQALADHLCQAARESECQWLICDDSDQLLLQQLARRGDSLPRRLVLGKADKATVDFATGCDPSYALIRKNLGSVAVPQGPAGAGPVRCLLEMSQLTGEQTACLIHGLCHRFAGTGVVFDLITPFARAAAEQLHQQNAVIRDYLFWHRNTDRTFQALQAFHLGVLSHAASFYEMAFAGIPALLLSTDRTTESLPTNLTSRPWVVATNGSGWVDQLLQTMEQLLDGPDIIRQHASEMSRLVDDQAALRLGQVLRQERRKLPRTRSA